MNFDRFDHTYAAIFGTPGINRTFSNGDHKRSRKQSFTKIRDENGIIVRKNRISQQASVKFINHDHNYHGTSAKVLKGPNGRKRPAPTSLLYSKAVKRYKESRRYIPYVNSDRNESQIHSIYNDSVIEEPSRPVSPPPQPDPILSQESFLFGLNLIPSQGNATVQARQRSKTFDTSSIYSFSISDPIVLNAVLKRRAITCDPVKEFYKTTMKVKHADCNYVNDTKRRPKDRTCKVNGSAKSISPLSQITAGYPKLLMRPVVEIERLLKIHCVRCARTSFFVNNTCYPRCKHLELLKEFVRKPSPSSIYKLSSKTIQRSQMQGELYFFYQT